MADVTRTDWKNPSCTPANVRSQAPAGGSTCALTTGARICVFSFLFFTAPVALRSAAPLSAVQVLYNFSSFQNITTPASVPHKRGHQARSVVVTEKIRYKLQKKQKKKHSGSSCFIMVIISGNSCYFMIKQ